MIEFLSSFETDQEETGDFYKRAGVIANLSKELANQLWVQLQGVSAPATPEDIPTRVGDLVLVLPDTERGSKGFEGTLEMKGNLPVARWKPRGFRLFGREVQEYSQTAGMALLLDVLGGLSPDGRAILVETSQTLGRLGLIGAIKMGNHASVASMAVDGAVDEGRQTDAPGMTFGGRLGTAVLPPPDGFSALAGIFIGAPRFELGTSSPPD